VRASTGREAVWKIETGYPILKRWPCALRRMRYETRKRSRASQHAYIVTLSPLDWTARSRGRTYLEYWQMKNIVLLLVLLLLTVGTGRAAWKPVAQASLEPTQSNRRRKLAENRWYRFAAKVTSCVLGVASLSQLAIAVWGPFWPTPPAISAENNTGDGSSETLPFKITNRSALFKIKDTKPICVVDLIYFMDADRKTGILRDTAYSEGAIAIDPDVAYYCDSKFVRVQPDGSFEFGVFSDDPTIQATSQFMTTKPGVFRPPIKVLKLCVEISGQYKTSLGMKSFHSAMFQWPAKPGLNQWVKGPIAFDDDQSMWIPAGSKLTAAWATRRVASPNARGNANLLPNALRCDWEAQPSAQTLSTIGTLKASYLVEPTLTAAKARSQQQCAALGCDGVRTIYWWPVVALTDGTAAVVIQASGPYSAKLTLGARTTGLTDAEIAALQTAAQLGALLPAIQPQP
jgi:hypothetical protein